MVTSQLPRLRPADRRELGAPDVMTTIAEPARSGYTREGQAASAEVAWLRWTWNHLPMDDEAYAAYAGLDATPGRSPTKKLPGW